MSGYDTTLELEDEPVFTARMGHDNDDDDPNLRAAAVYAEANYAYEENYA